MIIGDSAAAAITSQGTLPIDREGTMVTPEYARAYIAELTRYTHHTQSAHPRATIAGLLRRLSR
jgi:hypothetical protein